LFTNVWKTFHKSLVRTQRPCAGFEGSMWWFCRYFL